MSRLSNPTIPMPSMPRSMSITGIETRIFTTRQVDLRHVARHDEARVAPHTRKEHLELRDGRVLRFVQNHEGVVERAAAHERERSDLHRPVLHEAAELRGGDHIVQRVVQRLQIRVEFLLHVTGQEAQLLAGLDGRARQNDTLDLPVAQRADGQRDGRIRLARAGRPDGEKQVVPLGEPQQPLLIDRPGPDDETGVAVHDHILRFRQIAVAPRHAAVVYLIDHLRRNMAVAAVILDQLRQLAVETLDLARLAGHLDRRAPGDHFQFGELAADAVDVRSGHAVQLGRIDSLDAYHLFRHAFHRSLKTLFSPSGRQNR